MPMDISLPERTGSMMEKKLQKKEIVNSIKASKRACSFKQKINDHLNTLQGHLQGPHKLKSFHSKPYFGALPYDFFLKRLPRE